MDRVRIWLRSVILFTLLLKSDVKGSIIFFEGSDLPDDVLRSSLTTPRTTPSNPDETLCMAVEDCPHLNELTNEELSRVRPCRFEDNKAFYPCVPPKTITDESPQPSPLPPRRISSESGCSTCTLGVECPETKILLDNKDFGPLKSDFKLCGFEGRNPKFCCPSLDRDETLRNAGSQDYDQEDYQLRDFDFQGMGPSSVKEGAVEVRFSGEEGFTSETCGYSELTRIRNGNDAGPHEHPWNAALLYKNETSSKVLCGGVMISQTEALTAAHCVRDFKGFLLSSILIGHANVNKSREVNITGVTLHPSYSRAPFITNDIAILHFDPVELNTEEVKGICMPIPGKFKREGDFGVVSGWGITEKALFSANLKRLDVEIIESKACEDSYKKKHASFTLQDSQICASGQKEDSDSCSGDSGSPLLYYEPLEARAVLLGITSFGTRKCDSSVPGVYTRVEPHIPWLRVAIGHARMSVVGIDFGNENCYISVARAGGIESIANDYSMRDTPSYVAFGDKQRLMGVAAKSQHLTNLKKTFFGFKPLIGRKFKDPVVQNELKRIPYPVSEDPKTGNVLLHVDYLGKSQSFTPKQVTAMLFTKLKHIAEAALATKVKDVVISVPTYYTDCERRCILDAAAMADLHVLKLMNDTTATALAYGIYKQDLPAPEEKARNVVFVDVGHRGAQAAACSFNKGKLSMVCNTFDPNLGGRNLNENIAHYFAESFKENYKIDVYSSPKAVIKLITEVEKLKKQMSANTNKLPLNIECFMNDKDVKGFIDRATFEEISQSEIARIEKVLSDCLTLSKWKKDDIYSVEIVGGSTRVPFVKAAIERVFGKTPNTTLNADEAVSRGCALQCAILSPTFKVREFSVVDSQPYPIRLKWEAGEDLGETNVFDKLQSIPFSKMLTFWKNNNFKLVVEYADKDVIMNPHIGEFEIAVTPKPDGTNTKVKVKARINLNGIFSIVSATTSEKYEVEEEVQMEVEEEKKPGEEGEKPAAAAGAAPSSDDVNMEEASSETKEEKDVASPPPKVEKQKKTVTKIIDLPVVSRFVGSLTQEGLTDYSSIERNFVKQDQMESDRLTCKNAVEEYVYDIRSKIHGDLSDFIAEEDRGKYSMELEDSENWLYEDGEDVEKKVYVDKLNSLKVVGEAVKRRKQEFDQREHAYNSFGHCLNMASKVIEAFKTGSEKYNHLDGEEVNKVQNMIAEKSKWLNSSIHTLNNLDKTHDPSILVSHFYDEKKNFEAFAHPILNKSKPKVEPPPPPASKGEEAKTKNTASEGNAEMDESLPEANNQQQATNMPNNLGEDPAQTMAVD